MSSDWIDPLTTAFFLFLGIFFLPLIQKTCHKRATSQQLTQFSKTIIEISPGINIKYWELIAMSLNSFMYENKFWKTKYFFYSGWNCRETFRTAILEPFSLMKDDDARAKSFKDSVPYIEQALEAYFAEVDKQWRLITTEKAPIINDLEDIQLPKETYRFKLTWILNKFFSSISIIRLIYQLSLIYILWAVGRTNWFCYLGYSLLMIVQGFQNVRFIFMHMELKMQYLSAIVNEQETGADGWNLVAKKMNRYLFEQTSWKDEEFFFDGIDCERFFNRNFLGLLSSKRSVDSKSRHVELWPYIREPQSSCAGEPLS